MRPARDQRSTGDLPPEHALSVLSAASTEQQGARNGAGLGVGLWWSFPLGQLTCSQARGTMRSASGWRRAVAYWKTRATQRRLAFWGVGGDVADRVAELIVSHISTPRAGGAEHSHVSADTTSTEVESQLVEDLEDRWRTGANGGLDDHECR
jgi:hypothetical protein